MRWPKRPHHRRSFEWSSLAMDHSYRPIGWTTYEQSDDPRPPGRPMGGPHVRPQKTDHAPKNGHGDGPRRPAGTPNVQCNVASEDASPPPSQAERQLAHATG